MCNTVQILHNHTGPKVVNKRNFYVTFILKIHFNFFVRNIIVSILYIKFNITSTQIFHLMLHVWPHKISLFLRYLFCLKSDLIKILYEHYYMKEMLYHYFIDNMLKSCYSYPKKMRFGHSFNWYSLNNFLEHFYFSRWSINSLGLEGIFYSLNFCFGSISNFRYAVSLYLRLRDSLPPWSYKISLQPLSSTPPPLTANLWTFSSLFQTKHQRIYFK